MRHLMIGALGLGLLLGTGCMKRVLLNVSDSTDSTTTILTTLDVKSYVVWAQAKYVFWECGPAGEGITCQKRCDVRDDQGDRLKCQVITPLGM